MWTLARYYDISSKADRGDIFIVRDQKSLILILKNSTTIFTINNKWFLRNISEYYIDFWKIMWHWSNDAENSALP